MKNIWKFLFLCLLAFNCQKDKKSDADIINFIPENSSVIIKTGAIESLKSSVSSNTLLQEVERYAQIEAFNAILKPLTYLKSDNVCYITLESDLNDSLNISFITKYHPSVFNLDSVPNVVIETLPRNNIISKVNLGESNYYFSKTDSVLFISNSLKLVENSVKNNFINPELRKLLQVSNENKSVSIVFNLKQNKMRPAFFKNDILNENQFSNYLLLDTDISQDDIVINGITKATDSSKSLINVFKDNIPQRNHLASITPSNIDYLFSMTFSDIKLFKERLGQNIANDSIALDFYPLETIAEAGYIEQNDNKAIVLRSIDASTTIETLSQNLNNSFRSVDIYDFDSPNLMHSFFYPLLPETKAAYYANINDFFIFSEELSFLESIISSYQNNKTLSEASSFKDMMNDMSDEASIFAYANNNDLNAILNSNFQANTSLNLDNYKTSAIQFIYDTDFAHVSGAFKTHNSKSTYSAVSEDLNINIDASILNEIQLVNNHTNNQKDIAIQDVNNNLYLLSNQGKLFWKKKIDGAILGDIQQIDMYKNGRLQLAFTTSNKLYVLDRNGKDVSPFPINFNDEITQPISIFDYDKKRKYRLMVTQGKKVFMYDQRGKIVSGFKYKTADNTISSQPKHFRIGHKDYIVFADGSRMEILDRVGNRRVNVKESIDFSKNEIFLYRNKFTTTNTSGELLEVDQNGNVNHKNLSLNENHKITTTSKTLVALSENKLTIKSNTIDLDYGEYTAPKIFYINDKIYVSTTDLQSKKVYLFDSQAKPIKNFPVFGNSAIEMDDIDNDGSLEVLVKGDDKSIIIYEIN